MAKPIYLTENLKDNILEEITKRLNLAKMPDGKFEYSKSFKFEEATATVVLTPMAFFKTLALIKNFDSEVAWHGSGRRIDENKYLIEDIVVYPQSVSAATVEMDETKYLDWLIENQDDERFERIIMQGHSHVDMACNPSVVDIKHQETILKNIPENSFYIFLIWNKKLDTYTKIYDVENNIMYENEDIKYEIKEIDLSDFLSKANSLVEKPVANKYFGSYSKYYDDYERTWRSSYLDDSAANMWRPKKKKYKGGYKKNDGFK